VRCTRCGRACLVRQVILPALWRQASSRAKRWQFAACMGRSWRRLMCYVPLPNPSTRLLVLTQAVVPVDERHDHQRCVELATIRILSESRDHSDRPSVVIPRASLGHAFLAGAFGKQKRAFGVATGGLLCTNGRVYRRWSM